MGAEAYIYMVPCACVPLYEVEHMNYDKYLFNTYTFGTPIKSESIIRQLLLAIGWRKGSRIIVEDGVCTGVYCHDEDFDDFWNWLKQEAHIK